MRQLRPGEGAAGKKPSTYSIPTSKNTKLDDLADMDRAQFSAIVDSSNDAQDCVAYVAEKYITSA